MLVFKISQLNLAPLLDSTKSVIITTKPLLIYQLLKGCGAPNQILRKAPNKLVPALVRVKGAQ